MSLYKFTGTSSADVISTYDLNSTCPGYSGFELLGLGGNDNISLSIMGRNAVDVAWGGDGNDWMSGAAYFSDYAVAFFDGGFGSDKVYFALMSPELNSDGKPNFLKTSDTTTEITSTAWVGSNLRAVITDSVERIGFGAIGETYLTEDIANNRIRSVNWNEEYARTYNSNVDWHLRGVNTFRSYHGFDYNDTHIGSISNGEKKEFTNSVGSGKDHEIFFDIDSNKKVYTYFTLSNFSDDLDLHLYKKNTRGVYALIKSSDSYGADDESFFKAISSGSYKLKTSFYEDLDGSGANSSFNLTIDSKSFLENAVLPNDPRFDKQWSLFNTGQANGGDNEDIVAPEAWKIQNKSPNVVIAVIDSGVRTSHEDLRNNLWTNPVEISGNGLDDDGNGYVDDIYGWNFVENQNWWYVQPHGTHVAGIIAAEGNNSKGITGVTWDAQLMCLDVMDRNGRATSNNITEAIYYAADNGADVINLSLGGTLLYTDLESFKSKDFRLYSLFYDALNYAVDRGCVVVCAAGNEDLNTENHFQIPASFSALIPGVISVAAVGNTGEITQYSNYSESVTIAAPGGDDRSGYGSKILSTYHLSDSSYGNMSGTSMAAPIVSGAAALIMQKNQSLTPLQVEEILTKSAYKHKSLEGLLEDGNYLNLEAALSLTSTYSSYLRTDTVTTSTWQSSVRINLDKTGSTSDAVIQAKQVDKSEYDSGFVGSIVQGTSDDDIVRGLAGFDQLFGKAGDDLIHGGNGRDIIDGGSGSDELHGDFGWNTFLDQQDGSKDLIAIKSDQHLSNFWYGKAGNSPNGEKADFIDGLDAADEIKIIGVFTPDISVVDNVTARGVTGIGIYAKGTLEAVYTGGNLSTSQIQNMTTGDGTTTAMNNQMWSYWGDNTVPALQA